MRLPLSWLAEYLPTLPSIDVIATTLTQAGIEVEQIETLAPSFDGVVVGEVRSTVQHPNADRLRIATVWNGKEEVQVVCGAPNCRPGIKTAFAMVGASLQGEDGSFFEIKEALLRKVPSYGMLCSGKELGIGSDDNGILEFAETLSVGTSVKDLYSDTIFHLSLTPNLRYCMSVRGIALELSAHLQIPFIEKKTSHILQKNNQAFGVKVQTPLCLRYTVAKLTGIDNRPSPLFIRQRLERSGMKCHNLIVDVTNYILLEYGQPLHAFDLSQLDGDLIVRESLKGEVAELLDGKSVEVPEKTILITSGKGIEAVAGIKGCSRSQVEQATSSILLEAAVFDPVQIRQSSKKMGIRTESSSRFEKGSDISLPKEALEAAISLLTEYGGAVVEPYYYDSMQEVPAKRKISLRVSALNRLLGVSFSSSEIEQLLSRLRICSVAQKQVLIAEIPHDRIDVKEEVDLIEEVARIFGYTNIPIALPRYRRPTLCHNPLYLLENEFRSLALRSGLQEMVTCDLISPKQAELLCDGALKKEHLATVLHPSSVDQSVLRPSLMPGMLLSLLHNRRHKEMNLTGFELGRVHLRQGERFIERYTFGVLLAGNFRPSCWDKSEKAADFFDIKGVFESIISGLDIHMLHFSRSHSPLFHPHRQAAIEIEGVKRGIIGQLHPSIIAEFDLEGELYFGELDIEDLLPYRIERRMKKLPEYPGSDRDWTITLRSEVPVEHIFSAIERSQSLLLEKIELLDMYTAAPVGPEKKNATVRLYFLSKEGTLTQEAVDAEFDRIQRIALKELA